VKPTKKKILARKRRSPTEEKVATNKFTIFGDGKKVNGGEVNPSISNFQRPPPQKRSFRRKIC